MNLALVEKKPVEEVLAGLLAESSQASIDAGHRLVGKCRDDGLTLREYLILHTQPANDNLNGYETALLHLGLPFKNDFEHGVLLKAASDTFQKFPGTRAMFPEVIDDILRFTNRQNAFESVAPIVANSRTISGSELISTTVDDDSKDRGSFYVSEGGQIPMRTIRTSQNTVGIFKHGSGYRTTYEFQRRATLDLLTPYARRVARELEISKLAHALDVLINGDGINDAAPVVTQSSLDGYDSTKSGKLQYDPLLAWIVDRASQGVPVDAVVGNYAAYLQWIRLFTPTNVANSVAEVLAAKGMAPTLDLGLEIPGVRQPVKFYPASAAPDGKLIGLVSGETLEELVEAGSTIAESDRIIENQMVVYTRTENLGYKLVFGDTRSVLNYAA